MAKITKVIKKIKDGSFKKALNDFFWICKLAGKYKKIIIGYIVLSLAVVGLGAIIGVVIGDLVNTLTAKDMSTGGRLTVICISLGIVNITLAMINQRIGSKIFHRVRKDLSMEVFDVILKAKWEQTATFHSGDIIARLGDDVGAVSANISNWIPMLLIHTSQFIVSLSVIIYYDVSMLLLIIIVAPIIVIGSKIFFKKLYNSNKKQREFLSELMSINKETFHNIQTIKAFGLDELFHRKREKVEEKSYNIGLEVNKYTVASWGTTYFCTQLAMAICVVWMGYRVMSGVISIGDLAVLTLFATKISASSKELLNLIPGGLSAVTAATRVREILSLSEEKIDNEEYYNEMLALAGEKGASVEIDNVNFSYANGTEVFDDVSISAKPGEIVALVGPSGEGKTTMLRLILGLITQQEGETKICVGDNEMAMNAATRRFISYVPQGNTMMHGTIAENLRLTCPNATEEAIINALKGACAYEFVSALPDGIYHDIGESGIGFSEGQNQRLAIARALMNPSPILLLDEATSALDVATERKVLNNLMNHENIRTCILTTHRPTVLTMCDKVYRIAAKKVRKIGDEEIEMLMNDF